MTLLNVKASTKDIDFMVPDNREHLYLTKTLSDIGYKMINQNRWKKDGELFVIDLYAGKTIHTTELLESPLKERNHFFLEQIGRLYLGVLNYYDLISSKMMRGTSVDFEDCLMLLNDQGDKINKETLVSRYNELVRFDISESRTKGHLQSLIVKWESAVE